MLSSTIVDELGFAPSSKTGAELLFEVFSRRYERAATLLTSNLPFNLLAKHEFDRFVEGKCRRFYAATMGRPGLVPGIYFRLLLIGYFSSIDSERGTSWRAGDSLSPFGSLQGFG